MIIYLVDFQHSGAPKGGRVCTVMQARVCAERGQRMLKAILRVQLSLCAR